MKNIYHRKVKNEGHDQDVEYIMAFRLTIPEGEMENSRNSSIRSSIMPIFCRSLIPQASSRLRTSPISNAFREDVALCPALLRKKR